MSRHFLATTAPAVARTTARHARAQDAGRPIEMGVLHSLSGTRAISDTTLIDSMEMLGDRPHEARGLPRRELDAAVVGVPSGQGRSGVVEGPPRAVLTDVQIVQNPSCQAHKLDKFCPPA